MSASLPSLARRVVIVCLALSLAGEAVPGPAPDPAAPARAAQDAPAVTSPQTDDASRWARAHVPLPAAQPPAATGTQHSARTVRYRLLTRRTRLVRPYTVWPALNRAIARIPHLRPRIVHWKVLDRGAWGATELDTGNVYIAPRAPVNLLYSIVAHEYAHVLQGRLFGGYYGAIDALARRYGYVGERDIEYAADCMARVEGAIWTNYTPCHSRAWRRYARKLLRRGRYA